MSMEPITLKLVGEGNYFIQEAYKTLRTNIQFCGKDVKVIAISSVYENEGKSTVSLHVAKSFAELGKKVLFVDADMRKSVIAGRNTTVDAPCGLSELLTGLKEREECFYPVQELSMDVIFSGPYPPNPVELLNSDMFSKLIADAREEYDYVIIDTPPLGQVIDAAVVAPQCDGVVLVLGSQKVHYGQAQKVVRQIEKSGSKVLGIVRNRKRKEGKKYYSYGHKKYQYGATEEQKKA